MMAPERLLLDDATHARRRLRRCMRRLLMNGRRLLRRGLGYPKPKPCGARRGPSGRKTANRHVVTVELARLLDPVQHFTIGPCRCHCVRIPFHKRNDTSCHLSQPLFDGSH